MNFFCHRYIIFIAKWVVVCMFLLIMFIPFLMKTESIVGWVGFFWYFFDVKIGCKRKKLSKQEKKLLWFTCIAKKCISSAPSTRDLKKKPYVPNFGYFSNCTSWSNYQYYFCLQTSDDKNIDSLEVNQWLKAACMANLFQLLKQIKETNERCCCHF